jgi:hypothetical protein
MIRNFVICINVIFFAFSFLACMRDPPPPEDVEGNLIHIDSKWSELPKGESFPWDDTDGFYPHKDNPYGFDRHTKPRAGSSNRGDSIVHASIASRSISIKFYKDEVKVTTNEDGVATLKINKLGGLTTEYEYYICNPDSPDTTERIDKSKTEQIYKFTNDMEKTALCRKDKNDGIKIMQELHIHTYDWKGYSFLPVYYGTGTNNERNALVISYEFWESVSDVYKQALIVPSIGNTLINIKNRNFINARVRGTYPDDCSEGDIKNTRLEIYENINKNNLPKRVIFQLGLPTKRFWPLKLANDNINIAICGNPETEPEKDREYDMVGISQLKSDCIYYSGATILWNSGDNKFYFKFSGEQPMLATKSLMDTLKLDIKCLGMAETFPETLGRQYVEEIRSNAMATTIMDYEKDIAFIILPWHGDDTKWIANHEMGHAMGLGDVHTDLPNTGTDNLKSEQGSLMFHKMQTGHKLRQRGMPIKDNKDTFGIFPDIGRENQWDCLQRTSPENSCIHQNWLFK